MTFESSMITYLTTHNSLKNVVSTRIYALHAPANVTFPFITYRRISTERLLTHDQTSSGLVTPRIQFDIYAKTYSGAITIIDGLRTALQGFQGTMSSLNIMAVLPALEQHGDEPDEDYYRLTVDYMFSYEE